jgi:hypothetical protein
MGRPWLIVAIGALFALAGGLGFAQGVSSGDAVKSLITLLIVAVGVLLMLAGIAHMRVSRALRRLALTRGSSSHATTDASRLPAPVPPGPLTLVEHRLAAGPAPNTPSPRGVSTLFLWVFDDAQTMSLLRRLAHVGPVYLLRGGGALIDDLIHAPRMAFGKIDRFIEESEAEVLQRMATFRGRNRNFLGDYRTFSMICGDGVWKFAFSRLLERTKVVVIDLSDFTPGHAGIEYELGFVLDSVALARVIFVAGPQTDRAVFDATVHRLWATLPETSPNYSADQATMHLAVTTSLDVSAFAEKDQRIVPLQNRELDMIVGLVGDAMLQPPPEVLTPPRPLPPPHRSR